MITIGRRRVLKLGIVRSPPSRVASRNGIPWKGRREVPPLVAWELPSSYPVLADCSRCVKVETVEIWHPDESLDRAYCFFFDSNSTELFLVVDVLAMVPVIGDTAFTLVATGGN
jgi:hypothetical protein